MTTSWPAGTSVFTNYGYKNVEEIKPGTLILSADSKWDIVKSVRKFEYQGKLIGLSCLGSSKKCFMHPDFTLPVFESTPIIGGLDKTLSGKQTITVNADTVRIGQFALIPAVVLPGLQTLDVGNYFAQYRTVEDNMLRNWAGYKMRRYIRMNLDFGKIIGYMVGAKTIQDKNLCEVTFDKKEGMFANDLLELLEKVLEVKPVIVKKKNDIIVRFTSNIVCTFLHKFFAGCYFPPSVWNSNEEFVRGIIIGLINSRGTYNAKDITFLHKSRKFLIDIKMLFLSVGLIASLTKTNTRYCLKINGPSLSIIYGMCGKNKNAKFDKLYAPRHKTNTKIGLHKNWSVSKIWKIVDINYHGQMYHIGTDNNTITSAFAAYT